MPSPDAPLPDAAFHQVFQPSPQRRLGGSMYDQRDGRGCEVALRRVAERQQIRQQPDRNLVDLQRDGDQGCVHQGLADDDADVKEVVDEDGVGDGDEEQDGGEGADVDEAEVAVAVGQDDVGSDTDQGGGEDAGSDQPQLLVGPVRPAGRWQEGEGDCAGEVDDDMDDVKGEERPVGGLVLAVQDRFGSVNEGCGKREERQQRRLKPYELTMPELASGEFRDEEAARGGDERGGGEVGPADQEQCLSLGKAAEDEEGSDPGQERQGEEGVRGVEPGARIAGVDEEGGSEEEGEAEQVERRREEGHALRVMLRGYVRF